MTGEQRDTGSQQHSVVVECPFEGCDWTDTPYTGGGEPIEDTDALLHYEREHAGKVRLQVTLEKEVLISGRDVGDIRERELERWEDDGYDVAHVRSEVLEEADDHPGGGPLAN